MKIFVLVSVMMILNKHSNSQLLATEILNTNVRLTVKPPYIVEGLKSQVDIVCTFKRDNVPFVASVESMVLVYSNKTDQPVFDYLASVNALEGHAHNVSHEAEVISGSIDNNGESQLHMRFIYPETHLIGLYMCEVTGFDQAGKPVTIYTTSNVVTSNITDVFYAIHNAQTIITSLVNALHNAESNIAELVNALQIAQSNKTDILETLHNAHLNLSETQSCHAAYTNSMHKVQAMTYNATQFYNGHFYYFSYVQNFFYHKDRQTRCEVLGGYLIELDTHEELNFIRDYLIKQGNTYTVWTGATDEEQEGVWVNKHNSTSRPSFEWAAGYPRTNRAFNCQCFHVSFNFFLFDCLCDAETFYPTLQYICEIPETFC